MQGQTTHFLRYLTASEEWKKKVRIPISLEAVVVIETSNNPVQSRRKNSSKTEASTFTLITPAIWLVKWKTFSFLCIKISKPVSTPAHSVLKVRFSLGDQLKLLPQIGSSVKFWVESSIINTNSNITENVVLKIINSSQKNIRNKFVNVRPTTCPEVPKL